MVSRLSINVKSKQRIGGDLERQKEPIVRWKFAHMPTNPEEARPRMLASALTSSGLYASPGQQHHIAQSGLRQEQSQVYNLSQSTPRFR